MKIQYSILNTLYVIFYNQKLDHLKHLTFYEPSRSKAQRHRDFWQFDYESYDRKVSDLINKQRFTSLPIEITRLRRRWCTGDVVGALTTL